MATTAPGMVREPLPPTHKLLFHQGNVRGGRPKATVPSLRKAHAIPAAGLCTRRALRPSPARFEVAKVAQTMGWLGVAQVRICFAQPISDAVDQNTSRSTVSSTASALCGILEGIPRTSPARTTISLPSIQNFSAPSRM